ncbi:cation transport protein-domain-containing protein [Rhypophila decipiens]|uniref:Potassium transport protein n=1 Tax=Rhypophila decipiens TaxID=261697 RepID=A0AAN6Y9J8_9PEZI|nr:cation transport protein-domain-containing protein [Rhypophila decipiens]
MDNLKNLLVAELKSMRPAFLSKQPHFNFISTHYFYIMGSSLIGSIVLFASSRGVMPYIDALFFASGASTQAGLNPIDVNKLNTFQQMWIYFTAMLTNPIVINWFVVVLRLRWFERRFQHIVHEARQKRGTISKSKRVQYDSTDAERGVNGRRITVMHSGNRNRITNDGILLEGTGINRSSTLPTFTFPPEDGSTANGHTERQDARQIKFAPMVTRSDGLGIESVQLPTTRSDEEHIAILERQRDDEEDTEVLRIPGPRDAERGMRPERVPRSRDEEIDPHSAGANVGGVHFDDANCDEAHETPPVVAERHQTIKIEEPNRHKLNETDGSSSQPSESSRGFASWKLRVPKFLLRHKGKVEEEEHHDLHPTASRNSRRPSFHNLRGAWSQDKYPEGTPYLSWEPTLGRNSAFPDLTEEQREELGGIEYRALKTLFFIISFYFIGFSVFGIVCLLPWILELDQWGAIVDAAGQSRVWWGFFTANSAFNDLGFTLTPDSMNSFNTAVFPLLIMSFLIIIGNTAFPVMLRFIIWVMSLVVPKTGGLYEEVRFLLDHPRRCFTLLFPSGATWWLFWLLIILNGLDVMFFIVLDLGSGPVVDLPAGIKVLNGLFEAASTRTAGFSCINLALLHPGVQVSYMIMMYISVFPIAISVRRTNVYEEKSLGVYNKNDLDEANASSDMSYVSAHLRRQLSFDLWYIFVGFFIVCISEGNKLMNNEFSMFAVLFEIVSAYGTVGMSLGWSGGNESLCSQFSVVGKLILIGMMIRGRHRGLPHGLDRAILLPGDKLNAVEQQDHPLQRSISRTSVRSAEPGILHSLLHPGPPIPEVLRRATHSGMLHAHISNTSGTSGLSRRRTDNTFRTAPADQSHHEDA